MLPSHLASTPESTPQSSPIRVMIVDDHAILREGLCLLLKSNPCITVVAQAEDRKGALTLAIQEKPDIILLDLQLEDDNSLDFLPELLAAAPQSKVIVLTGTTDLQMHREAISLGALGLVLKDRASKILLKAIERVNEGEVWIERSMMANVLTGMSQGAPDPEAEKIASLSPREREAIGLISRGLKNKEIATEMFISEPTVRHHLSSAFDKLEVSDRLELVIYAFRHKLIEPPQ